MDAQLAGGRPEGESLELGLVHILPQSPLASGGYLPFGGNVFALGRQELAGRGPLSAPGYVGSTEDRLCEPHFQSSTVLSDVRVYGQNYLGAETSPLRNQDKS